MTPKWSREDGYWQVRFTALGCPCEILIDSDDEARVRRLGRLVCAEVERIEQKYSRYRADSALSLINDSAGRTVYVDDETAQLLDYAEQCWRLSQGRFDITSGLLRRVWRFDGSDRLPAAADVAALLEKIGWHRLNWQRPELTLAPGMEIDLGGIGKEYAVDRCARLLTAEGSVSALINFGGDIYVTAAHQDGQPWHVAIEQAGEDAREETTVISLQLGGIATSGDAHRYLLKDGVRYSHILDPVTGWPVRDAPRSVTVVAGTCTEAGMLATFAMLQGADAEAFLEEQKVQCWCLR
jgi:thiamine biosynthesis lipoprotein